MDKLVTVLCDKDVKRADKWLSEKLFLSRSFVQSLIERSLVSVSNIPLKKSDSIKAGQTAEVRIPPEEPLELTPREIKFEVVYDSERFAVIDKPAGLTVHPGAGHMRDSLVNGLLYMFNIKDEDAVRPGIVHRLDKDTSGLLIVAKDREARERLSYLFSERRIEKYYLCAAYGRPNFAEVMVEAPIGRDRAHRQRMCVTKDGRPAKSAVKVLAHRKGYFLAEVRLFTGRTHQIRVHMKHLKHPILGDKLYGVAASSKLFSRQALHAHKLIFEDPFTGEKLKLSAELPEDMKRLATEQ